MQLAQEAYQAMCEQYGENSEEALAYKETLLQEILTQQQLQGEIDETTAALNNARNAQLQFQAAAQNALTATDNFGWAINTLGSATSQFGDMIGNQTVSDVVLMFCTTVTLRLLEVRLDSFLFLLELLTSLEMP